MLDDGRKRPIIFQIEHERQTVSLDAEGLTVDGVRYGFEDVRSLCVNIRRKKFWDWGRKLLLIICLVALCGQPLTRGFRGRGLLDRQFLIFSAYCFLLAVGDILIPAKYYVRLTTAAWTQETLLEGAPKKKLEKLVGAYEIARWEHDNTKPRRRPPGATGCGS